MIRFRHPDDTGSLVVSAQSGKREWPLVFSMDPWWGTYCPERSVTYRIRHRHQVGYRTLTGTSDIRPARLTLRTAVLYHPLTTTAEARL